MIIKGKDFPKGKLILAINAYDAYIQNANDEGRHYDGWKPVCFKEFCDEEFQNIREGINEFIGSKENAINEITIEEFRMIVNDYFRLGPEETFDIHLTKKVDYVQKLQNTVFAVSKEAPTIIEGFDKKMYWNETADQCDLKHSMDYQVESVYPQIKMCLEKNDKDEWKFSGGWVGHMEDDITLTDKNKDQLAAAYVLQKLGIIESAIDIINDTMVSERSEEVFVPNFDRTEGTIFKWSKAS